MIREVSIKDADQICKIYNHYIENTIVSFEEQPVSTLDMEERIAKVISSNLPWLIMEDKNSVVGYAYSSPWSERGAYRHSVGVTIYLLHDHTGRGLGFELYSALFDKLRSLNVHSLIGGIALPNPGSVALHEKMGMIKVAHYKEIGFKFGDWVDVAFWQLII
ncbi:GNAT family N-acetyltransferase [bacterium]|nr:GNAT family N-acetyltransferase [bacterium]